MMILYTVFVILLATFGMGLAADGDVVLNDDGLDEKSYGLVLIEFGGKLGKVCNYDWDVHAADVVCKQTKGTTSKATGYFDPPKYRGGEVFLDGVKCQGNEESLMDCAHGKLGQSSCPRERIGAGVICWSPEEYAANIEGSVRLVDGLTSQDGRVEVYLNSSWGLVCDDQWGAVDADTVCKQLGCTDSKSATTGSAYGEGSLDFKMTKVECASSNTKLVDCPYSVVNQTTECSHTMQAGAVCNCGMEVTVGDGNNGSGLVQVSRDGAAAKTLCSENVWQGTGDIICKEAGFAGMLSFSRVHGSASTLSNISYSCDGTEVSLAACKTSSKNVSDCTENWKATVECQIKDEPLQPSAEPTQDPLGLGAGAIAGIVIGVLAGLMVIVVIACVVCRGQRGRPASI